MAFLDMMETPTGFIDPGQVRDFGTDLAADYADAAPFPHVVIDDFLPEGVARLALDHFHSTNGLDQEKYDRAQERFKNSYNPDTLDSSLRTLFYAFNSRPFIRILENITGIKGLIPDPLFLGGGLHEISQGGHLSVHADFNHHGALNLERRINVLIYLNRDWRDEYGGQLELWDEGMTTMHHSIVPLFNRCVVFNTTSNSMHGNPQPVHHPDGVSRKSIALYYYTSTWDGTKRAHTTQFQVRPKSGDRTDWQVRRYEWKKDYVPPIFYRWQHDLCPPIIRRKLRAMINRMRGNGA